MPNSLIFRPFRTRFALIFVVFALEVVQAAPLCAAQDLARLTADPQIAETIRQV